MHVLTSFEVGGGEQVALNLAASQVALGHSVHVFGLDGRADGPHAENFRRAGVTPHRVARRGPSVDPSLPARLALWFRWLGASLVHTHNPMPLAYGGAAAKLARLPLIHTKHGFNADRTRRTWLRRVAGYAPDVVVAVSQQTAKDARLQRDCPPQRLRVIPNGISLSAYAPDPVLRRAVRAELDIPQDAWIVGSVGRLSAIKNQPLLIEAVAPMLSASFRLVLVGDGEHRPFIEAAIARTPHPEYVHLLGQRLDVPRLLPSFDVFALSSDSEGLPMVLPEAMASGLPIVSTAVGGVAEVVVEGRTGHLAAPGDATSLRRRLSELAQAPAFARTLGQSGRELALQRHGAESMTRSYMELYAEVIAARGRRRETA
jgi:glycosyltransferase involved in cell wall biosynthesis